MVQRSENSLVIARVIDAYRAPEKETAIETVLANPEIRDAAQKWIGANSASTSPSPMVNDLKERVTPRDRPSLPKAPPTFHEQALQYVSSSVQKVLGTFDAKDIENEILSKDLNALRKYFSYYPEELLKHADLIKIHLEMNTLNIEDLLPILSKAAVDLTNIKVVVLYPPFIETLQYPSFFSLFHSHLIPLVSVKTSNDPTSDLLVLIKQDLASQDPYFSTAGKMYELCSEAICNYPKVAIRGLEILPIDQLIAWVSTPHVNGNIRFQDPEVLKEVLPILLDRLSTKDLVYVYQKNAIDQIPISLLNDVLDGLSELQKLRLATCLVSPSMVLAGKSKAKKFPNKMSDFVKKYVEILKKPCDFGAAIQSIYKLVGNGKLFSAGLAYYIEYHQIDLKEVKKQLEDDGFFALAPYLRYADLRRFTHPSFANSFLRKCPHLNVVLIDDAETVDGISEFPECQKFECIGCEDMRELMALPQCKELNCSGCTNLIKFPDLSSCEFFVWSSCLSSNEPLNLPSNCRVISTDNSLDPKILKEDVKTVSSDPVSLLLKLDFRLSTNGYSSFVKFLEKYYHGGQNTSVKNDVFTQLFQNLFKGKRDVVDRKKFLFLGHGLPLSLESIFQERCFRAIGRFFSICYQEDLCFKTGTLFDENFYSCIADGGDPGNHSQGISEEWLLLNYLKLYDPTGLACQIVGPNPYITQDQLDTLIDFVADPEEERSKYHLEYFKDPKNQRLLRKKWLNKALKDPKLRAIAWIAHEMKKNLTKEEWKALQNNGALTLRKRIQGKPILVKQEAVTHFAKKKRQKN